MQVTCPQCRALADRTYKRPLLRLTKCRHCGYEQEEVNVKEAAKIIDLMEKEREREIDWAGNNHCPSSRSDALISDKCLTLLHG